VSACLLRRYIRGGRRRVTRTRNQRANSRQRAALDGRAGQGRYENAIEYEIAGLSKFMTIYAYCVAPLAGAVGVRARDCPLYINYTVRPRRDRAAIPPPSSTSAWVPPFLFPASRLLLALIRRPAELLEMRILALLRIAALRLFVLGVIVHDDVTGSSRGKRQFAVQRLRSVARGSARETRIHAAWRATVAARTPSR
jgi:hypothetical protein